MVTQCHKLTILRNQNDKSLKGLKGEEKGQKFSKLFEKQSTSQNFKILNNTPKLEQILQKGPKISNRSNLTKTC